MPMRAALWLVLAGLAPLGWAEDALVSTPLLTGQVPLKSWKTLRDERVVKQDLDYSCGAAALATLLSEYYRQPVSEAELLKAMDKGDGRASFEDMQRALPAFGFKAQGFAASYAQLARLKMPVVVYLKHRKDDHFSVLRGIDGEAGVKSCNPANSLTRNRSPLIRRIHTHKACPALQAPPTLPCSLVCRPIPERSAG